MVSADGFGCWFRLMGLAHNHLSVAVCAICERKSTLVAPCYSYRDQRQDETPEAYGKRVADELETEILAVGAENVMAFIAEPVVGATAGALTPVKGYFQSPWIESTCAEK